jgi:alkylation response protein AidB-like acyl-CoA dehydrogenase
MAFCKFVSVKGLSLTKLKYAISLLNEGRIGIAAQMLGLGIGAFEQAAK